MASDGKRRRGAPGDGGRFLPPDPRVSQPYLLTPKMALRVAIMGAIALVVFGILFLRLWSLQVLAATKYRSQAQDNQIRQIALEAPRGPILDSKGRPLVVNTVSNAVVVWPADLPKGKALNGEIWQLAKVLDKKPREIQATLAAQEKAGPIATTPVTLQVGITSDQAAYIYEHSSQFTGVEIKPTYLRYYNSEGILAQTLGYVGRIDSEEYTKLHKLKVGGVQQYLLDDRIGQAGVESAFDRYLHGVPGTAQVTVDSTGRPTSQLRQTRAPQPGRAIRLTIDSRLQRAAESALASGIKLAHATKDGWAADGGAIVAMDPNTGAILALASNPTYKPRVWVYPTANGLKPLLNQKAAETANYPLLNRAIDVTYPPGSTWKPVTALAALEQRVVGPYDPLLCSPSYSPPNPFGGALQTFHNWDPNVSNYINMPTALMESCDTYFYRLGYDFYSLPANEGQPMQAWAEKFGFGKQTGIDIGPEASGLVPTIKWRKETFTRKTDPTNWQIDSTWKPGDSIQLAIGQKDVAATPLQLARFYSMIANGGKLVTPYLVQDAETPSSGSKGTPIVLQPLAPPLPKPTGVDPTYLQVIRDGLFRATHDPLGTSASTFANFAIPVAGKTGTAEKVVTLPGQAPQVLNQSLWCGWGPYDHPTIVVCAVIENGGHGGTAAAPAAAQVLAKFFNVPAPTTGKVTRLMVQYIGTAAQARRRRRRPSSVGQADDSPLLARLDWTLLLASAALVAYGLWAIGGITRHVVPGDANYYLSRQFVFVAAGAVAMVAMIAIDPEFYRRSTRGLYIALLGSLAIVLLAGSVQRHSRRWIDVSFFRFQPSEFGKLLLVVFLAAFLADRLNRIDDLRTPLTAIALAVPPIVLVFAQPDLGSALVYVAALGACLFIAGTRWSHLAVFGAVAVVLRARRPLAPTGRRCPGATQVPDESPDRVPASGQQPAERHVQREPVDDRRRLRRRQRARHDPVDADEPELPAGVADRLRVRRLRRAARLHRRRRASAALPARRLAGAEDRHDRAGRLLGDPGRGDRLRVRLPDLRQRGHDDRPRPRHGHHAALRQRRRIVADRQHGHDRAAAVDPRPRPAPRVSPKLPLAPSEVLTIVKELRSSAKEDRPLVVAGARELAQALGRELTKGGVASAVREQGRWRTRRRSCTSSPGARRRRPGRAQAGRAGAYADRGGARRSAGRAGGRPPVRPGRARRARRARRRVPDGGHRTGDRARPR